VSGPRINAVAGGLLGTLIFVAIVLTLIWLESQPNVTHHKPQVFRPAAVEQEVPPIEPQIGALDDASRVR
jgi:hypothetical protein